MRIVTWNCNMSFSKKLKKLLALKPDIAVIQECEEDLPALPDGVSHYWYGNDTRKGVCILSFNGSISLDTSFSNTWTYFIPVNTNGLKILAVWAYNHRASRFGHDKQGKPLQILPFLDAWLDNSNTIILGDFNNSVVWDKPRSGNNFADISNYLDKMGFKSAYHKFSGQTYGIETDATFYHIKKHDKQYHIDYCFCPKTSKLQNVQVGKYHDWIEYSDHAPIIVDIIL